MSDISVVTGENTLTITDSIETGSPVELSQNRSHVIEKNIMEVS